MTHQVQGKAAHAGNVEEQSPAPKSSATDDLIDINKPCERMYFFKRFIDGHPRLDVLLEVGAGQFHMSTKNGEFAMWEATDDLYIYRKSGLAIKVLQSIGNVEYTSTSSISKVKHCFGQKTCGFVGIRDSSGHLQILKLAISGTSFTPRRDEDKKDFIFHQKWSTRVKQFAELMKIKLRTIYDGHGRKSKPENIGNWRAGHVEKKLSAHILWTFLAMYHLVDKSGEVSLKSLRRLRQLLQREGTKPQFELHLSRGPCGTPQRSGQCVPFVRKLSKLTGIRFTIHSWEENMILDGSVPAKRAPRDVVRMAPQDREESPGVYDSEVEDLDAFLDEAEAQDNIVYDGFEEAIPPPRVSKFRDTLQKFERRERRADRITKPYPPTPVDNEEEFWQMNPYRRSSSRSHFWEDRRNTPSARRRRSVASEDRRDRRARKNEVRRRRRAAAAASASEATNHSAEMSALAGRLGGLLNSSRRLR